MARELKGGTDGKQKVLGGYRGGELTLGFLEVVYECTGPAPLLLP